MRRDRRVPRRRASTSGPAVCLRACLSACLPVGRSDREYGSIVGEPGTGTVRSPVRSHCACCGFALSALSCIVCSLRPETSYRLAVHVWLTKLFGVSTSARESKRPEFRDAHTHTHRSPTLTHTHVRLPPTHYFYYHCCTLCITSKCGWNESWLLQWLCPGSTWRLGPARGPRRGERFDRHVIKSVLFGSGRVRPTSCRSSAQRIMIMRLIAGSSRNAT